MVFLLIGIVVLIVVIAIVVYWQLVVTEGAYLGRPIVALMYDWFAPRYDKVKEFDPANDAVMLAEPILSQLRERMTDDGRPTTAKSAPVVSATVPLRPGFRAPTSSLQDPVVLDVATGTGRLPTALLLQPAFRGRIIAIDASDKMLEVGRHKLAAYAERIEWQHADAQHLDFPDNSFDVVTSLEALEFFPSPDLAVQEMIRVLRPGGLFMISNRVGPDAWKFPGRVNTTAVFCEQLERWGMREIEPQLWLVDYDLVTCVKSGEVVPA